MLKIQNLSLKFPRTDYILHDITFSIKKNEVFALVGESGSGKTLTALSVLKLSPQAQYKASSSIKWKGDNILNWTNEKLRSIRGKEIGYIFQEAALNPTQTIGMQVSEVFLLHEHISSDIAMEKAAHVLASVGFKDAPLHAYPHELSGGQKQRILIAIAIAISPDLIIADEPTSSLDRSLQRDIIDLLEIYKKTRSMLLISHDMSVVKKLADRIAIIYQGHIIEEGSTQEIFENPKHDYTKMLIHSGPQGRPVPVKSSREAILKVEKLNKFYKRRRGSECLVLSNINFELKKGHTLGIIGESGAGKTTLAKILVKLEEPSSGSYYIHQKAATIKDVRHHVQMIFQNPFASLNPKMTIKNIIEEGLKIHKPHVGLTAVKDILHTVGLDVSMLARYPHQFSGGQCQRIAIARALAIEPEIVILDEPTSSLDRSAQKEILLLLRKLQKEKGLSYILITHDLNVIKSLCHEVIVLKNGSIIEHGLTQDVFTTPQHTYTQKLVALSF